MDKEIQLDLANETSKVYGPVPSDFADRMVKRIRRKFKVKVDTSEVADLADTFKNIYSFGKGVLSDYLGAPKDKCASVEDISLDKYRDRIAREYPKVDTDLLVIIGDWVIYWEYLR